MINSNIIHFISQPNNVLFCFLLLFIAQAAATDKTILPLNPAVTRSSPELVHIFCNENYLDELTRRNGSSCPLDIIKDDFKTFCCIGT